MTAPFRKASSGRHRNKRGQTLAEYALILALISVVAISVLSAMGTQVNLTYSTVNNQMTVAKEGGATSGGRTQ